MALLNRVPFLSSLADEDREYLSARVRRRAYSRGETIFSKGDPGHSLFIVESGTVRIYIPGAQGTDLTLAVMGPGDSFGDMSLLDGSPRSASAAALTDAVLYSLERTDFTNLILTRPEAALAILTNVARRLRDTNQMASDLAFMDVRGRLARKLLELAESAGVQRDGGVMINVPLTQEDLANMIGVTRESVNRNLSEFRKLGLVGRDGRKVIIRDPAGLQSFCE